MVHTLRTPTSPLRLAMFAGAFLLLATALVAAGSGLFQPRATGSHHSQSVFAPLPPAGSGAASTADQSATQTAPQNTAPAVTAPDSQRSVSGAPASSTGPAPAQAAPSQATGEQDAPAGAPGCTANPVPGRDIGVCATH